MQPKNIFLMSGVLLRNPGIQLQIRTIKSSARPVFDARWRAQNRLSKYANGFGPLTNMPDFSYKDGRPAPFGVKQMIRINKNREYLETIKKLSGEIDGAVERHASMQKEKEEEKQRILDSKLKPKGHLFT